MEEHEQVKLKSFTAENDPPLAIPCLRFSSFTRSRHSNIHFPSHLHIQQRCNVRRVPVKKSLFCTFAIGEWKWTIGDLLLRLNYSCHETRKGELQMPRRRDGPYMQPADSTGDSTQAERQKAAILPVQWTMKPPHCSSSVKKTFLTAGTVKELTAWPFVRSNCKYYRMLGFAAR